MEGSNIKTGSPNLLKEEDYKNNKVSIVVEEVFKNTDIDKRRIAIEEGLFSIIKKSELIGNSTNQSL